jgi:hypothetical protein
MLAEPKLLILRTADRQILQPQGILLNAERNQEQLLVAIKRSNLIDGKFKV